MLTGKLRLGKNRACSGRGAKTRVWHAHAQQASVPAAIPEQGPCWPGPMSSGPPPISLALLQQVLFLGSPTWYLSPFPDPIPWPPSHTGCSCPASSVPGPSWDLQPPRQSPLVATPTGPPAWVQRGGPEGTSHLQRGLCQHQHSQARQQVGGSGRVLQTCRMRTRWWPVQTMAKVVGFSAPQRVLDPGQDSGRGSGCGRTLYCPGDPHLIPAL